ncbi:MAG TPA: 7-carboxy-7-deazaguanine synthase QueE [Abditibacteriaceae bacterium]|jgi:7-carboxy-7-deazaguanine synthase
MKPILISEIFGPTIQGEGALVGRPTLFVRTGGCDFRCDWCDSLYAVLPEFRDTWRKMSAEEIVSELDALCENRPMLVTLSGGNPALQPLDELLRSGHQRGYTFAMETQGSTARDWFAELDYLVLSPKPPSSKMTTDWNRVRACRDAARSVPTTIKIVVFDEADYQFARAAKEELPDLPFYLQVGNANPMADSHDNSASTQGLEWLLARALRDGWKDVTILPQLHVLLWGNKRGV